ncbi:hypothetical protein ABIE26_004206 [Pedobacter africanus]|uniref:Uncharacterized protein n=1 Tax=Pedobacter africanus TaxID=151894 RepID=A0ACC6L1X8_9SPHI|nr:hypothetical protein [Pedobacter africanus]MDR6785496.1 hypothetical protein [Pedobacter africanus]
MSIYLEFPAIEDYPVYIPLEHITAIIPDWLAKLVQSSVPETGEADN